MKEVGIIRPALWVCGGLLVLLLAVGCGGDNGGDSESMAEIPDALTAFLEAFANNDVSALGSFWSDTCDPEDVARAELTSLGLDKVLPGEYHLSVGPSLETEVSDDIVKVPLDQPEGAVSAIVTVDGQEAPVGEPFLVDAPLELVLEDGSWKVRNCGGLFVEE